MIPTRGEVPSVELPSSRRMRLLSEFGDAGELLIRMYEIGLPYQENLLYLLGDMQESTQEEVEYFFTVLSWRVSYESYAIEYSQVRIARYRDPVTARAVAIAIHESPSGFEKTGLKSFFWVRKQL